MHDSAMDTILETKYIHKGQIYSESNISRKIVEFILQSIQIILLPAQQKIKGVDDANGAYKR